MRKMTLFFLLMVVLLLTAQDSCPIDKDDFDLISLTCIDMSDLPLLK